MENLRPNEQRAKNAITLIRIVLVLEIVSLFSSLMQYDLLQTAANGGFISDAAAEANDTRQSILGTLYLIAYMISGITFIMWFRRAYFNLHQKVNFLTHSEGWAAGCWFIPIINLYRPYQIMKEIYVETKKLLTNKGLSEKVDYSTSYLNWWWTLWVISGIIGQFIFRFSIKSENTIENITITTVMLIISSILGIPLTLITVKVIKDYSKVEPLLAQISDEETKTDDENELLKVESQ